MTAALIPVPALLDFSTLGAQLNELSGTPYGGRLALILTLFSAFAHAVFGAANKAGGDPFLNRGAINLFYGMMAAPVALFVVEWPSGALWGVLALSYLVHLGYEVLMATGFQRGAFTVVYPIARGVGPLTSALAAIVVFDEVLRPGQWGGVALLSGAIMALSLVNLRAVGADPALKRALNGAILAALAGGVMLTAYTITDAYGARLADNPFTFIAWFFMSGMFGFPLIAVHRWRKLETKPKLAPILRRGFFGACVAFVSFGTIIVATRLGKVGEVAALRETSIIFGAIIGVVFFRERLDAPRIALIALIAAGAVLVELG